MKPYFEDSAVTIYHGDCREALPALESIDCLVTDPPYGLSFMGKDWDKAVPSVAIWKECLRVLKPGAFAFVMCIPRQDCLARMICNLQDAGFETGFTSLYWAYASGFPKAQNIGKAVDKRGGVSVSWFGKWLKEWRTKNNIPQKEIAKLFPSKTGGLTGCVANWELGFNVPTPEEFTTICRHFNLPFESIEEAEREVIEVEGKQKSAICWGEYYGNRKEVDFTLPATPQARALDGSYAGFQPKPAVEVIIVAMKPLSEKTYVDQAMKNGRGITWLDDGRIPFEGEVPEYKDRKPNQIYGGGKGTNLTCNPANPQGRFPANLLVSDDVLNDGKVRKACTGSSTGAGFQDEFVGGKAKGGIELTRYTDSGSFSRYFDLDKWADTLPFLITPKASKSEKNKGCEGLPEKERPTMGGGLTGISGDRTGGGKKVAITAGSNKLRNPHPTVKPVRLMAYLVTMGSRPGDTVLDPFMGTGTTGVACQQLGRKFIGIEIAEEYSEIAAKRMVQSVLWK